MVARSSGGSLIFDAGVDVKKLKQEFEKGAKEAKDFSRKVTQEGKKVDQGFNEAAGGVKVMNTSIGNLAKQLGPLVGIAGGAGLFYMVINQLKKIRDTSDKLGTEYDAFIGGMKGATEEFYRTLATGDWSQFKENMKEAIKLGRDYQFILDDLQEKNRAYQMANADVRVEMLELEDVVRNVSLADEERLKAANRRIEIEENLAEMRKKIALDAYNSELALTAQQTRLSKERLEVVIRDFDSETKARAKAYNEQKKQLESLQFQAKQQIVGVSPELSKKRQQEIAHLKAEIDSVSDAVKFYAEDVAGLGKTTDAQLDKMVKAWGELKDAEASVLENTTRVRTRMYSIIEQDQKEVTKAFDQLIAGGESVKNVLSKIDELKKQLGTGTIEQDVEIQLKIENLEKLVKKWEKQVQEAVQLAWSKVTNEIMLDLGEIPTTGEIELKVTTIGEDGKETLKTVKEVTKEISKQLKPMKTLTDEEKEQLELLLEQMKTVNKLQEGFQDTSEILGAISYAVGEVDRELGQAIGKMADLAYNAANLLANISSGNVVGAVASGIGMLGNIFGIFNKKTIPLQTSLESLNITLEKQNRLLGSLGGHRWFELATKQLEDYRNAIQKIEHEFQTGWFLNEKNKMVQYPNWDIEQFLDAYLKGTLRINEAGRDQLFQAMEDQKAMIDLQTEIWDKITGTTQESIAEALIEGFQNGYGSAEDFAENFEELMKRAILESLKTQIMEGPLMDWYRSVYEAAKDGLTEDEIESLRLTWDKLVETQRNMFEQAEKLTGMSLTQEFEMKGLTGAIQGITEETAGLIAGQFTAMRYDLKNISFSLNEMTDQAMRSLAVLYDIRDNTRDIYRLKAIEDGIKEMNFYLKKAI